MQGSVVETKQEAAESWREALLQRLLLLLTPFLVVALAIGMAGSHGRNRVALSTLIPPEVLLGLAAFSKHWSYRLRVGILLAPFALGAALVYLLAGFASNAGLLVATGTVMAALLLGKRAMLVWVATNLIIVVVAGYGFVGGTLQAMSPDISLTQVTPWLRLNFVSLLLWGVLGLSVTFVVERVEGALRAKSTALEQLREEETRRQRAEAERLEAEQAAQQAQKMELVGRLAAGVAHDFNNVLAIVSGWSDILFEGSPSADDKAEAHSGLSSAVQQGSALTRQLLALARRDARKVSGFRLEDTVKAGIHTLGRVLPSRIKLRYHHCSSCCLEADETELQQVLFNLVINARDAIAADGTIDVATGVEETSAELPIVGGSLAPGRWVFLRVADSGSGIPPDRQARIFELFFTTKPLGEGTGMGLSTVLRIAQLSGGGVALDSQVGRGTTFTVYLPEVSALVQNVP
ncbi:MAG TPA: ATP-binding protein [Polyangiaceae bacterium]|jgi:signal transduction histidine kinase